MDEINTIAPPEIAIPIETINPDLINQSEARPIPQGVDRMRRAMVLAPFSGLVDHVTRNFAYVEYPFIIEAVTVGPVSMSLTASDRLSYDVAWNHMGLRYEVFEQGSVSANEIDGIDKMEDLLRIGGVVKDAGLFIQIAQRFEKDELLVLLKKMIMKESIPIIAPDTLYIDRALFGDTGKRINPRDYIGRKINVIPVQFYDELGNLRDNNGDKRYSFDAYLFDVKAEHHRNGEYHAGDANPSYFNRCGVYVNYPSRPYFQIPQSIVPGSSDNRINNRFAVSMLPSVVYTLNRNDMQNGLWDPREVF